MVNIKGLIKTLTDLEHDGGDDPVEYLENALLQLHSAVCALDTVVVHGRDNVDTLFGCMMALDMIIGKEDDNGK